MFIVKPYNIVYNFLFITNINLLQLATLFRAFVRHNSNERLCAALHNAVNIKPYDLFSDKNKLMPVEMLSCH